MKKRYKRTAKQYAAFRKAFKKWTAKYKSETVKARIENDILNLYSVSGSVITSYIAPDYTKYMTYVWRNYL